MKILNLIVALVLIFSGRALFAQALPEQPADPDTFTEPPLLMPDTPATYTKPPRTKSSAGADKNKSTAPKTADDLKERIRFREARTLALKDGMLQDLKFRAEYAKTDARKREVLREFYERLYAKIVGIDGTLKTRADLLKAESMRSLTQKRNDAKPEPDATDSIRGE